MLSFEYKASPEQFGPMELLDYSILVEQRGFDSVFISDRFQPGRPTGGDHGPFFSIAGMGTLGAMFPERVILGVVADLLPAERAAKRWIVSTDPDQHVEKIGPCIDMGFRHLVFHAPSPDEVCFLNLYADQVLPRLHAVFG